MKLEELIQKRFTEREGLTKFLAKFGDYPAIFSPEAPKDNQNWGTDVHYPRLVYNYDMQADEERKSAGTLSVSLLCQNTEDATEEDITPEMLEPLVRDCLKDVLLHSEDGKLYAFAWNRTDAFELAESKTDLIIGSDVRFDILEYTSQETTDPDPVMAMNKFVKELYPECIVVGLDRMEEITEASRETPVIYCRLNSMEKVWQEKGTVLNLLVTETWINMDVTIDSFTPDPFGAYGDVSYGIKFSQAKDLKIYTTNELKIAAFVKKTVPRNDNSNKGSSYTIVSGDTLWGIASRKLGSGTKWTKIYDANASTIEAAAKKHGKSSSDHGHWIWPGTTLSIPAA